MAFHFVQPRITQHLLQSGILTAVVVLGSLAPVRAAWAQLVESAPDMVLVTLGPWIIHQILFWLVSGAYHYVDVNDRPRFIARHRIQSGRPRCPPMSATLRVLAWNQLLWAPIMLGLMAAGLQLRGWTASPELPGLLQLFTELILLALTAMVFFYTTHRLLHRRWWMKRVHRLHHEFKTTTAMASEYAHPVEFCIGNFGTLAVGIVIFAPSLATIYLFALLSLLQILIHHGGYALPWAPWALPHDWHHYRVKEVFGTTGFIDRLLGTDTEFRELKPDEPR